MVRRPGRFRTCLRPDRRRSRWRAASHGEHPPLNCDDAARLERLLGRRPERLAPQSGGDIARGVRASFANGLTVMAKFARPGQASMTLEARMLEELRDAGLPVPATLAAADDVLLLEWIEPAPEGWDAPAQAAAGRALAALHARPAGPRFGHAYDTPIGPLLQCNDVCASWRDFYRDRRLLAMAAEAADAGHLPTSLCHRIDSVARELDHWLDPATVPSLLHGDLWGGNLLARAGGGVCFIDPAIYHGDGEVDLAMTRLFDSVDDAFFDGYRESRPVDPDFFTHRCVLYQIYPLLVHVRLFGAGYLDMLDRNLARLGC